MEGMLYKERKSRGSKDETHSCKGLRHVACMYVCEQ